MIENKNYLGGFNPPSPGKTLHIGDPVTLRGGYIIKWTEDCGLDLLGYLPQGSKIVGDHIQLPNWFYQQVHGGVQ